MSQTNRNHILSRQKIVQLEKEITEKIEQELRQQSDGSATPIKDIANEIMVSLTTVKKWYEGRNPPSLGYFIILCRHYDDILKAFLMLSGHEDLSVFVRPKNRKKASLQNQKQSQISGGYIPENVTINGTIKSLNHRQRWFLDRVCRRITPSIEEIMNRWATSERTVRRDIAELVHMKLIKRVGSRKNGDYVLL